MALGGTAREQGRVREATGYFDEALALLRSTGHTYYAMHTLADLGDVALDVGETVRAAGHYRDAVGLAVAFGHRRVVVRTLAALASVAAATAQAERAARLFGAGERLREATGIAVRTPADRAVHERAIAAARAALGEAAFAAAWAAGRALTPEQAIAEALALSVTAPGPPPVRLSPREREILPLLAAGQTYPEIAAVLFVSPRTVEHHVARLFAKLGVRTRVAAVEAARTAGLLSPPTAEG
jgi:non-specific serine/threonine protein kinase